MTDAATLNLTEAELLHLQRYRTVSSRVTQAKIIRAGIYVSTYAACCFALVFGVLSCRIRVASNETRVELLEDFVHATRVAHASPRGWLHPSMAVDTATLAPALTYLLS